MLLRSLASTPVAIFVSQSFSVEEMVREPMVVWLERDGANPWINVQCGSAQA